MNINYSVPQKWDDLTEWQHNRMGWLLFNKSVEASLFKYIVLFILLIPGPGIKNICKVVYLLTQVPLSDLMHLTDFVYNKEELLTRFRPYYKVRKGIRKVKLYGPAQRLSNITALELSYADTFFFNWINEKKDIDLHRLCAVLYREKDTVGDIRDYRVKFSEALLVANSKLTDRIQLHQKYMIALAYQGSRQVFEKRYPQVFPKRPQTEKPVKENKKVYSPFSTVITSMALDEVKPFGTLEQTEMANANKFLEIVNEMILRAKKRERKNTKKTK